MAGCAFGPCDKSKQNGGDGCHLCDVVATGKVVYRIPGRYRGDPPVTVSLHVETRVKDALRRGEAELTRRQAKKAKNTAK